MQIGVLDRQQLSSTGSFLPAVVPVVWLLEIINLHKNSPPVVDKSQIDWEGGDKNHILKGTKGKHIPAWERFGFDPKDPKSWAMALPIIKEVVEKGKAVAPELLKNGTWLFQYSKQYIDQGVTVVVQIWVSQDGIIQKLSDAIPYVIE